MNSTVLYRVACGNLHSTLYDLATTGTRTFTGAKTSARGHGSHCPKKKHREAYSSYCSYIGDDDIGFSVLGKDAELDFPTRNGKNFINQKAPEIVYNWIKFL